MRAMMIAAGALAALWFVPGLPDAAAREAGTRAERGAMASDLSAQSRRRARPRITVRRPGVGLSPPGYGTDADLSRWKRDCVAVFTPRFIPASGETVIFGSRRCRWVLE